MLRTTYNYRYQCDRCGKVSVFTHYDPDWTPRYWYLVNARRCRGEYIDRYFCPDCGNKLFGYKGKAYEKPEELSEVDVSEYDASKFSKLFNDEDAKTYTITFTGNVVDDYDKYFHPVEENKDDSKDL